MTLKTNSAIQRNRSFLSRRVPQQVRETKPGLADLTTVRPSSMAAESLAKKEEAKALKAKYAISDNETYDALYLKVRKLFLESL